MPKSVLLKRLISYFKPYKTQTALGIFCVIIGSAISNAIPALIRRALDSMGNGMQYGDLWSLAAVMLVTAVMAGVFRFGMRELMNSVSRKIETDLRRDVFEKLTTLDAAWYGRHRTGDLMARMTNDMQAVRMAAGPAIMYMVNTIFVAIFSLTMMVKISASLTVTALLPMIGLPVIMIKLGNAVHTRFKDVQDQFSTLTTRAQENIAGVRVVRASRQENDEIDRFSDEGDEYLSRNMRLAQINSLMNPSLAFLAGMGAAITVGYGGRQMIAGEISMGAFVAFSIYLAMLTWPLIALGWTTNLFQRGMASMKRVVEILDAVPVAVNAKTSDKLPTLSGKGRSIEFKNVWFAWPNAEHTQTSHPTDNDDSQWALKDISFSIAAGSTLAITGATGSGKTALLDLIPRIYEAQRGEIKVDGVSIKSIDIHELRESIGYVPQETLLFSDTIAANVTYGVNEHSLQNTDAIPVELQSDIEAASDVAQFTTTVRSFPKNYDTQLGERGINLSGGQKQRAALVRALARKPEIVLLDDSLSAVDTQTEAAILRGLKEALEGRTAIIASHRISAVRNADTIIVLENGRIVERGNHEQLIELNQRYAGLFRRQQLIEEVEAA